MTAEQETPQAEPAVILIGPPGAGKTTVGSLLAGRLGLPYLDTDTTVEAVAGKPVADIFVEDGEPAFRALEHQAVAAALSGHEGVLGLGGGAVLDERIPAMLAGRQVVFLDTGFAELAKRVGMDKPRPLMIGINPRAQLKTMLDQRRPVYAGLAGIVVTTDGREPEQIADEIAGLLADARG